MGRRGGGRCGGWSQSGTRRGVKGVGSKTGLVREWEMKVNINSTWEGEGEGDGVR